jgi:hypothetical protein
MSLNIKPYSTVLRALGYTKEHDSRAGGIRTVIFARISGDRKIEIQLWGDGQHRASHFLNGIMSTPPTEFKTVGDMCCAICKELTRVDHPNKKIYASDVFNYLYNR